MADLRLALVFAAACGSAGAQPDPVASGLTPPAGWQTLPAAATAAKLAAAAPGITVDGAQAWGEPAKGCYALWLALRGGDGGADAIAREIVEGLAANKVTVTGDSVTDGVFEAAIERAPYKGRLRARIGEGKLAGVACVANQREPAACQAPCKALLGGIP